MTKIVAILNITPDSFSDGGVNFAIDNAINTAQSMIDAGVDVIDIGGQSTRPGSGMLTYEDEWHRLRPVIGAISSMVKNTKVEVSVDSYHYQTIEKAMLLGIDIVNDVSGSIDDKITEMVAEHGQIKMVLMHNLGIPADLKNVIMEVNHLEVIEQWGLEKIIYLKERGISDNQIIFDPGIGFGKNAEQAIDIIKKIDYFKHLGQIMVGHSRKSFIKLFSDVEASQRDIETHIASAYLAQKNIAYLRVHDFIGNSRAINIAKYLWE